MIAATIVLAAVYKWTKFGLATRAASENEVAAMLGGVSPGTISLTNSLVAAFIAGALGILASTVTQLDPSTLPLQIIPALAAALIARFTSFGLVTAAAFGIGILDSLLQLASGESWFPQSGGVAIPGTTDLLAFLIIIGVLFWRGARIPGRGEVVERRLPEAPRPQHLWRSALIFGGAAAVLLVVFPFDFRNALINTLIGILMALSLVVITGFVGQISIIQLALAGAAASRSATWRATSASPSRSRRWRVSPSRSPSASLPPSPPYECAVSASPSSPWPAPWPSTPSASRTPPGAAAGSAPRCRR